MIILFVYLRRPVSLIEKSAEFADALDQPARNKLDGREADGPDDGPAQKRILPNEVVNRLI